MTATVSLIGRIILLLLLGGHLIFRREFAHRNLGDIFRGAGVNGPAFLNKLFITEMVLLLLAPAAIYIFVQRILRPKEMRPGEALLQAGAGPAFYGAVAILALGLIHAAVAVFAGRDFYLIARQSVLAGYAVIFCYAFLFFGDRLSHIRFAALAVIGLIILCAGLDVAGLLKPRTNLPNPYFNEPVFGQETLPIGMLALGLFIVTNPGIVWQGAAVAVLGFLAWRESAREFQTVVPVGLAGAVVLYVVLGAAAALRGQVDTLKRAALLLAFFAIGFLAYRGVKKATVTSTADSKAISLTIYRELFDLYDRAELPVDPAKRFPNTREPGKQIDTLESHKLETVYHRAKETWGDGVVNNMWRLLLWRKMFLDWRERAPVLGVGVGKTWDYNEAMFPTSFHYEPDPSGLNPHNSYLHWLYRYGAVGAALLISLVALVVYSAFRALRTSWPRIGDTLLEAIALAFFYTAIFSFFTVALEGPSYGMPFWFALGLLYARARQQLAEKDEKLS